MTTEVTHADVEPPAAFYMYTGPAFPTPDALLACRALRRLLPLNEPMAQFYAEIGMYRQLSTHPARVRDPAAAELFYVPVLPHLSVDAGSCNGTGHRARMAAVASALRASEAWQRQNGTDHVWACTCVMMKSMLTGHLWELLAPAVHAVHAVPRGRASPSACELTIPYFNPSFAAAAGAPAWREPGRPRPILAHFRGRVMNRVRAGLVKRMGGAAGHVVEAAHPSTAARCNLNKCNAEKMRKVGFSAAGHFEEMTRATFCLVPTGDSPPSSRLYLAVAAGCLPVMLSDGFEGAFPSAVPWRSFSLRFAEADIAPRRRDAREPLNLTAALLRVAADAPRLARMQRALQAHAADVLWEAPGSRAGHHALGLATLAVRRVCPRVVTPDGMQLPFARWGRASGAPPPPAELLPPNAQVRYDGTPPPRYVGVDPIKWV